MRTWFFLVLAFLSALFLAQTTPAQTTLATGSIQGRITDPRGGALNAVKITFTSKATGAVRERSTNPSGLYTSGALIPGYYDITMEAKGFQTEQATILVLVGITHGLDVKMFVRAENRLPIQQTEVQIYSEQPTVQGVITAAQINGLPVTGRNFAQLATLEPGVQIQDGSSLSATKIGTTGVSFGGRWGRSGLVSVDGIEVGDEKAGGSTQNIAISAIREFNVQQSFLDPSTELTGAGTVNVVTRSGSKEYHGQAFYLFRDHSVAAALPGGNDNPFQKNQFGGAFGGPVIQDKLFFYVAGERVQQNLTMPVLPDAPFTQLSGNYNAPLRQTDGSGRLDWLIKPNNYRFFYRFSYDGNRATFATLPTSFQPVTNVSATPTQTLGLDFTTGVYTHSLRFGYMKFHDHVADAATGGSVFNPAPQLELAIGNDPACRTPGVDQFCSGPSPLAPQVAIQSNYEIKWDVGRVYRGHLVRFGVGYNRIQVGGYSNYLGAAPAVNALAGTDPNPLDYLAQNVILGNGQGFASEKSAFGFPGGGFGPDNRVLAYIGDSWKLKHNITLNYALRYQRDTARTDSDLPAVSALNQYGPGFGNPVKQANMNFGPQAGIAWDPTGNGKTVVRGGIGLFYENNLWNNLAFDRAARVPTGQFGLTQQACIDGVAQTFTLPGTSTPVTPTFCGQPVGTVESQIALLQQQYQAATSNAAGASNPGYIGNSATATINGTRTAPLYPQYQTPRTTQINIGVQHELRPGTVVSIDYLHNVETHTLLGVDVNHVGDARYLNTQNALNAITATLAANAPGCLPAGGIVAGGVSQTAISCYLAQVPNASIGDFAANGLDSGNVLCGGGPCPNAAFYGVNPVGTNQMLFPSGRSVYSALQVKFNQNIARPGKMVSGINLLAVYTLSKLQSTAQDSDYVNAATDNAQPTAFFGPNALDRKHQLSFGTILQLPFSLHLSLMSHFYSALPSNLLLPTTGKPGGIFVTDVTGDGSGDGSVVYPLGDPIPGTNLGALGGTSYGSNINSTIQLYNAHLGATPAGAALIRANIINFGQLSALKGVEQALNAAPMGQQGLSPLRSTDITLDWDYRVRERFVVTPSVSIFNVFNFANFDGANNPLSPILNTAGNSNAGALNSTTYAQRNSDRVGVGSGVFGLGSPRVIEFGLRVRF